MDDWTLTAPLAGWLSGLDAVPDRVFATGMIGAGIAIDPIEGVLYAPCPGMVLALPSTGHAITLRGTPGFELLLHLGIDTVARQGRGFRALVQQGDIVKRGAALIAFELDALVCASTAIITPMIVTDSDRYALLDTAVDRLVSVGDRIARIAARDAAVMPSAPTASNTVSREVAVLLAHGIHARPAARIVATARAHHATGCIIHGQRRAALTSLVELMGLGIGAPTAIRIEASGVDARALLEAITTLLGEVEARAPTPSLAARSATTGAWGTPVGVPAAPGMAIGPAHWLRAAQFAYDEVGKGQSVEQQYVEAAWSKVAADLDRLALLPGVRGAVLSAHRALLDDPDLRARTRAALEGGRSAPAAIHAAVAAQAAVLRGAGERRIAERADDLHDVGRRLIAATLGQSDAISTLPPGAILLADELLPSQLVALDGQLLGGICLKGGGPTAHVAILAAGMGVPMLVAAGAAIDNIVNATPLILDAEQGTLAIHPDTVMLAAAQAELALRTRRAAEAETLAQLGCTADGIALPVYANLGSLADARSAVERGAEGCGLLRTEFLFIERDSPPNVAEQTAQYQAIADALGTRPLVIRLLDVGGDKPAPYLTIPAEENPALGLRGIRIALARPEVLETQLRAILAVQPAGSCRIMLPMVSSLDELMMVRTQLQRLCDALAIQPPPLGIMVETPAAAIATDLFADHADFFSIGSNDLTQYTLAMDRGNAAVAGGIDGLHPAVLRLIAAACDGAVRQHRPVSVCGGLAAETLAVPILIGLGVRTLSVPPTRIAAIRALLARLKLTACQAHARAALQQSGPQAVRALARAFAQEHLS